jgi:hypothetical protein
MAIKKKPFKNFNGTSWDDIYFETSEDQIKSGWVQNLWTTGGCRKLPGGMIIQWGSVATPTMAADSGSGGYKKAVTYPILFTTAPVVIVGSDFAGGFPEVTSGINSAAGVTIICNVSIANCNVSWIAIGY